MSAEGNNSRIGTIGYVTWVGDVEILAEGPRRRNIFYKTRATETYTVRSLETGRVFDYPKTLVHGCCGK